MDFRSSAIRQIINQAIAEDIGNGDHSANGAIPQGTLGKAKLIFKDDGIVAGIDLAQAIFEIIDEDLEFEIFKFDGDIVKYGDIGLHVMGSVHSILKAERLVLNLMQRLSGIATYTSKIVSKINSTSCKLLDTRKTTPNLRILEKWAVTIGGGHNHRFGLYDMVMLKDNHVDYNGSITNAVLNTQNYLKTNALNLKIEVETRNLKEVEEALSLDAVDRIMFDNFDPETMTKAVQLVNGKKETEASGGITIDNVLEYAQTGVDFISIGALTHSVKSMDISLKQF